MDDLGNESNDVWQRCARKLPLNTPVQLSTLTSTLQLIIQNCLENLSDPKYFRIKVSGKTFQSKIAPYEAGLEFLNAVGFVAEIIDHEKYLRLSIDIINLKEHLESSIAWLLQTMQTCLEMIQISNPTNDSTPCADSIIQIRLPNNTLLFNNGR